MSLKDRIGADAGKTRLEDAIQWAIDNEFFFLDFNADAGPNHMDSWTPERTRTVRDMCESNGISIGLHTLSAVNVAEFSPYVSRAVEEYMRASVDLSNSLDCAWTVVHAGYHFSGDIPERKRASLDRLKRICKYGAILVRKYFSKTLTSSLTRLKFTIWHTQSKRLVSTSTRFQQSTWAGLSPQIIHI